MCINITSTRPKAERSYHHTETAERYFHRKVAVGQPDECWLWTGAVKYKKRPPYYGAWTSTKPINGRAPLRGAHQSTFLLFKGEITKGLHVLHTCDNSLCCNPEHLYLGTNDQNVRDRTERGRYVNWRALEKHKDHPFKNAVPETMWQARLAQLARLKSAK